MSAEQLCQILRGVKLNERDANSVSWHLPSLIATSELETSVLERLRDGLVTLVSEGLRWQKEWQHVTSDRPHLSGALAATCVRGLDSNKSKDWLHASVLALCLHQRDHAGDDPVKSLRERLTDLDARDNALLFWAKDALMQSLHETKDSWERLIDITIDDGPVQLKADRDLAWVCDALGDTTRDLGERALLLEAAIRLPPDRVTLKEHGALYPIFFSYIDKIY